MKKTAPAPAARTPSTALPQSGGSYIRLADGSLQLEEATDNSPEVHNATPLEDPVQSPVKEA